MGRVNGSLNLSGTTAEHSLAPLFKIYMLCVKYASNFF